MINATIWILLLFVEVPLALLAEHPKIFPAYVWAIIGMTLAMLLGQASVTIF